MLVLVRAGTAVGWSKHSSDIRPWAARADHGSQFSRPFQALSDVRKDRPHHVEVVSEHPISLTEKIQAMNLFEALEEVAGN